VVTRSRVAIRAYRVFYDRQVDDWGTIGGSLVRDDETWIGVFGSGPHEDDDAWQHPVVVRSRDQGLTWTEPENFGPPIQGDRQRQSLGMNQSGPTQAGTMLVNGCHMQLAPDAVGPYQDLSFRAYTLVLVVGPQGGVTSPGRTIRPVNFSANSSWSAGYNCHRVGWSLPSGAARSAARIGGVASCSATTTV